MTTESLHLRREFPPAINPDKWESSKLDALLDFTDKIFSLHSHSYPEIIINRHSDQPMQVKERVISDHQNQFKQNLFLSYPHPQTIAEAAGYDLGYQSCHFPMVITAYDRDHQFSLLKLQGISIKHPSTWTSYTYLCGPGKYQDSGRIISRSLAVGKLPSNFMFDLVARNFKELQGKIDINPKSSDSRWLKCDSLTIVGCEFAINDQQQKVISQGTATCITQPL